MQEQDTENATRDDAFAKRVERLRQLHPSDVAEEIEGLELDEIREILRILDHEVIADIIPELPQEIQTDLMENMRVKSILARFLTKLAVRCGNRLKAFLGMH